MGLTQLSVLVVLFAKNEQNSVDILAAVQRHSFMCARDADVVPPSIERCQFGKVYVKSTFKREPFNAAL
jgi:hypothetical protein